MTRRDTPTGLLSARAARLIALALLGVCVLLVAAEFLYVAHPYFGFDGVFAIYPIVGAVSVLAAVLVARLLRPMIGRAENYYGEAEPARDDVPEDSRHE